MLFSFFLILIRIIPSTKGNADVSSMSAGSVKVSPAERERRGSRRQREVAGAMTLSVWRHCQCASQVVAGNTRTAMHDTLTTGESLVICLMGNIVRDEGHFKCSS